MTEEKKEELKVKVDTAGLGAALWGMLWALALCYIVMVMLEHLHETYPAVPAMGFVNIFAALFGLGFALKVIRWVGRD